MAKKQETKKEVESTPQVKELKVETPVMETPKPKKVKTKSTNPEDNWEIKDRMYYLTGNKSPLTYLMRGSNVFYFDEEKGYERELKYTTNQTTAFVDEFKGVAKLEHITFEDGTLTVPKRKQTLQRAAGTACSNCVPLSTSCLIYPWSSEENCQIYRRSDFSCWILDTAAFRGLPALFLADFSMQTL